MNRLSLIVLVLLYLQSLHGQTGHLENWILRMDFGIEQHDKRLFDYSILSRERILREFEDEQWGTYHIGIDLQRRLFQSDRVELFAGLGIGYEKATFRRPFNQWLLLDGFLPTILLEQNRYRKLKTPTSLLSFIRLGKQIYLTTDIRLNWLVYRSISSSDSSWSGFPYYESTFELDDIHLRGGIAYRTNNLMIGLDTKIINFQKIDKILFNEIIYDPRVDEKWEWYNPLMLNLTIGYMW